MEERVDIVITDKVDASISTKLRAFAAEARVAYQALTDVQNALVKGTGAQQQAAAATSQGAAAQAQAAIAAQRLQTAQVGVATATINSASATARLAVAQSQAQAAQTRVATAVTQNASAQQQLATATANSTAAQDRAAIAALRLQQAQARAAAGTNNATGAFIRYNANSRLTSHQLSSLSAQIQDFFIQVQGGQSVITAFTQQFSQVASTSGGVSGAISALGSVITPVRVAIGAAVAVLGAYALAIIQASNQTDELNKSLLLTGNFAALTDDSFRKLTTQIATTSSTTVGNTRDIAQGLAALGTIGPQSFDKATEAASRYQKVSGDTAEKTVQLFQQIADSPTKAAEQLSKSLNLINSKQYELIKTLEDGGRTAQAQNIIYDAFNERLRTSGQNISDLGGILDRSKRAFSEWWNAVLDRNAPETIEDKIARTRQQLESLQQRPALRAFSSAPPSREINTDESRRAALIQQKQTDLSVLLQSQESKAITDTTNAVREAAEKKVIANDNWVESLRKSSRTSKELFEDEKKRLDAYKKEREFLNNPLSPQAYKESLTGLQKKYFGTAPKPKKTEEEKDIARFDAEIKRLQERNIELKTTTELESIQAKIEAGMYDNATPKQLQQLLIESRLKDQHELANKTLKDMEREYDSINQKTATRISQNEQEIIAINAMTGSYREELDLLVKTPEAIDKETLARKLSIETINFAKAANDAERLSIQQKMQALQDQAYAKTQLADKTFLEKNVFVPGTDKNIETQDKIFEQQINRIEELRQLDIEHEQDYQAAITRIRVEQERNRMQKTLTFAENLASLQGSKIKELAAIGKAAALFNAIIKGKEAIVTAAAGPPGLPYSLPWVALATSIAASNIASIIATPVGFQAGGYTGDGATDRPAGVVHGREFVVNAEGTANNRWALEAMNRGDTFVGGMKVTINDYGTKKEYKVEQVSRDEVRIIARDAASEVLSRDGPGVVAADMSQPNSRTSKAMSSAFQVARNRS